MLNEELDIVAFNFKLAIKYFFKKPIESFIGFIIQPIKTRGL